ncbi:Endochitinase [Rhynchospora pubera]|uniref:chitinase n=1 Tax=Rhynchospora pubera TaxID=906938 RepID=A0AAV8DPB3_9POAL|nr:Endochitinase [Rhynchospora pubera]
MRFSMVTLLPLLLTISCISSVKAQGVGSIITSSLYDQMLPHRNPFYTHEAFIKAASSFPAFGTTGKVATRKRDLAAFFGQTSHETTGGTPGSSDANTYGYYFIEELNKNDDAPYYGRGPMQITHKYNYEQASKAIGLGNALVDNPGMVSQDTVIAFKTAIWYWMTAQGAKPSCHDVMTGKWIPTNDDRAKNRLPGYGLTTNIINGGFECGKQVATPQAKDRVSFYRRYSQMLGVDVGANIGCLHQTPYG